VGIGVEFDFYVVSHGSEAAMGFGAGTAWAVEASCNDAEPLANLVK